MSMNRDDFERETKYESRMALARTMLRKGIITEDEYAEIDANFLSKYRPVLGSLRAVKMPD
jgi:hypothetical protein